jgi:hypothetical protein
MDSIQQKVEKAWVKRNLNPRSKRYPELEFYFFQGAIAAMGEENIPATWAVCMMSGRPIVQRGGV